ncbi:MAG: acyl carrier protein [Acetobacteraceae bacterium]|nr:acyl carrier protein [Acetobacteraceae bacterium]
MRRNTRLSASEQLPFENEIARLIVESLHLEIGPEEIVPEQPLFGEGLGLDSIDALELALVLSRDYGMELRSDDPANSRIFQSLRSFAAHIQSGRTKQQTDTRERGVS